MPQPTNTAGEGARDRNCANCSAAGVVRITTLAEPTSGQAARGGTDDKPDAQTVGGIDGQLEKIASFVRDNTARQGHTFGSAADEQPYEATMAWMRRQTPGTAFVVYASGPIVTGGVANMGGGRGRRAAGVRLQGGFDVAAGTYVPTNAEIKHAGENRSHFLCAQLTNVGLVFSDYQTDVPNGGKVTPGEVPFLGIMAAGSEWVSQGQVGAFENTTSFVVLAFPPRGVDIKA